MGFWQCALEGMGLMLDSSFWQGKRVLLTGHSGFKGCWMALWLQQLGAKVTGFSLAPDQFPNMHTLLGSWDIQQVWGDIRHYPEISKAVQLSNPEIVIHMAAQPLVQTSLQQPLYTFETNLLGTVNLLEALRGCESLQTVLVVTSDKVYQNDDTKHCFKEADALGGSDPYSVSKACVELVVRCWQDSYARQAGYSLITARAGNVIGGGDWATDRLIPDFIRAIMSQSAFTLRNPHATRPWQHVLDVTYGYLKYAESTLTRPQLPFSLNFGPAMGGNITTLSVIRTLQEQMGLPVKIETLPSTEPSQEKKYLSLDVGRAKQELDWQARLTTEEAIRWTTEWYLAWLHKRDMKAKTLQQIAQYQELLTHAHMPVL